MYILTKAWFYLALALPAAAQWRTGYFMQSEAAGQTAATIPWSKYTHVVHYALRPTFTNGTCRLDTVQNDITGANIGAFVGYAHAASVKALIGISEDSALTAIEACTTPQNIAQFVALVSSFVSANQYDGVDIEWGDDVIPTQYLDLIAGLRAALPTATLTAPFRMADARYMVAVDSYLDQINAMAYGLDLYTVTNPQGKHTENRLPSLPQNYTQGNGVDQAQLDSLSSWALTPSKIGLGVPFYGRFEQGCLDSSGAIGVTSPSQTSLNLSARFVSYRDLINSPYWSSGAHVWNEQQRSQYISYVGGTCPTDAFIPFSGPEQLQAVVAQIDANNFGGIMTFGLPYEYIPTLGGYPIYPLSAAIAFASAATTTDRVITQRSGLPASGMGGATYSTGSTGLRAQASKAVNAQTTAASSPTFTYYVDSISGSDSKPGTLAQPWKTLAKVNSTSLKPGQSVGFNRGETWRGYLVVPSSGVAGNLISFGAYGAGANPVINASVMVTGMTIYSGYIWKIPYAYNPSQVLQDNVRLAYKTSLGSMMAGSWYWNGTNTLYIWTTDSKNPSTHVIEAGSNSGAGSGSAINCNSKSYVAFDSIDVEKARQNGYNFQYGAPGCSNITVSNSTASWNGLRGFGLGGYTTAANNVTFTNDTAHDNLGEGFWIGNGSDNQVLNSESFNNGNDLREKGYPTSVSKGAQGGGVVIGIGAVSNSLIGSYIHDNGYSAGVLIEYEAGYPRPAGTIVKSNTIVTGDGNNKGALGTEGLGSIISYNLIFTAGNNTGVTVETEYGSTGESFFNNTIYQPNATWAFYATDSSNVTLKNNIIQGSSNGVVGVDTNAQQSFVSDYNCLGPSATFTYWANGNPEYQYGLVNWQAVSGQDLHSIGAYPMFTATSSADFGLAPGSPAIGAGLFITGVSLNGHPNIGAF